MPRVPPLLTVPEAARDMRVSRSTVYAAIREGHLRAVRLTDERVRLTPEALRDWVRGQERAG